uniref:ULP_PROTEASE domain-containing protein n=1 Tax=Parastrongyloides trichosuri TaxID=131310 RepID=A0A0N4ZGE3_PARTI
MPQLNNVQKRPRVRFNNEQTNNIVSVDSTDSQVVALQKRANVTDTLFRSDVVLSQDTLASDTSHLSIENSQELRFNELDSMISDDLINRKIESAIIRNELVFDIIKDKIQKNLSYKEVGERIFNIIGLRPTSNDYDKVCIAFDKKIYNMSNISTISKMILYRNKDNNYRQQYDAEKDFPVTYFIDYINENRDSFIFDNDGNQQVVQQNMDGNYILNANIVANRQCIYPETINMDSHTNGFQYSFTTIPNLAGGNCGFYSIVQALNIEEFYGAQQLRADVADFQIRAWEDDFTSAPYSSFGMDMFIQFNEIPSNIDDSEEVVYQKFRETYKKHFETMETNGEYISGYEMVIAAFLKSIRIYINRPLVV